MAVRMAVLFLSAMSRASGRVSSEGRSAANAAASPSARRRKSRFIRLLDSDEMAEVVFFGLVFRRPMPTAMLKGNGLVAGPVGPSGAVAFGKVSVVYGPLLTSSGGFYVESHPASGPKAA